MIDNWAEIDAAIRSNDADRVNDAIDRIGALDLDERLATFDARFDALASIYEQSEEGYVRQSVVRVVDELLPGLPTVTVVDDDDVAETPETVGQRLDTAAGFLIEALQDDDGRVRQSAQRALKDVFWGYDAIEDGETVDAIASELADLADQYEGSRRNHLLEAKMDAEHLLGPPGGRLIESIRELVAETNRSDRE
ncbi:MAG: hypothetical protein ACOCYZ_06005 [Halococcoides sp.]